MRKLEPLITIVIPTYNNAHLLIRTINSLVEQIYENWEAIIIDNHSQDNTLEVVNNFRDKRIKLLKIYNKGIIGASRNMGIYNARGEWIAFLDSDDWWTKDKLLHCVEKIKNSVDIIYHDLKIVKGTKIISTKSRQLKSPVLKDLLLSGNLISNSSVLVRTKLLKEVNGMSEHSKMIGAEDYNLWLKLSLITNNFFYLPMSLGFYEYHESGISRKEMSECHEYATLNFLPLITKRELEICSSNISYMRAIFYYKKKKLSYYVR
jgi:glycosyltransferase involved in cell wall biosynthesis